ncbi:MAG TPA: hypothetical protein VJ201_08880 [Candidatus Babeliales bacterium]|nr:hypothetical protein [Candidatus Babeliales bacterium]
MYSLEIVTHPLKIKPLINDGSILVKGEYTSGPIGFKRYLLETDDIEPLISIAGNPFEFVILTDVLDNYNTQHFIEMCKTFLELKIGAIPDEFDIIKYAQPRTTHFYPMYRETWRNGTGFDDGGYTNEYLYVCEEEEAYLEYDPLIFLGLYPVTTDPLCWRNMTLPHPVIWNGACLIKASYNIPYSTMDEVDFTLMALENSHRSGNQAEKTSNEIKTCSAETCQNNRTKYAGLKFTN